jgi:hypothetical protein
MRIFLECTTLRYPAYMVDELQERHTQEERELQKEVDNQNWKFAICELAVIAGGAVLINAIFTDKISVSMATAIGSGVVLAGSCGQAIDELSRAKKAWRYAHPVNYFTLLQFASQRYLSNEAGKERAKQAIADSKERNRQTHRQIPHDVKCEFIQDLADATRKARNWLIIVGGSCFVLLASIHDAVKK